MSSFRLLIVFSEAAQHGSFAAAARELGLSSSAVVKGVARLEASLRVRLFHRTTRSIRLTQEGEALFERCRRILAEVEDLERAAGNVGALATGVLRVGAPLVYGRRILLPVLARLATANPEMDVDLRLSDVYADVMTSGLDAVVRVGEVADSSLTSHTFDSLHLGVFASPAYLARRGRAKEPRDLGRHDCVLFRGSQHWTSSALALPEGRQGRRPRTQGALLRQRWGRARRSGGSRPWPRASAASHRRERDRSGEARGSADGLPPTPLPVSLQYAAHRHVPRRLLLLRDALLEVKRINREGRA